MPPWLSIPAVRGPIRGGLDGKVQWPPAWNPFEAFLLSLSLVSSIPLLQGNSGSQILDERLNDLAVTLWGAALLIGSGLALTGMWFYRTPRRLMRGWYLERAGLMLVASGLVVYSFVIVYTAADVSGVRWSATVQIAYAIACAFRAWQDHRAITLARQIYRNLQGSRAPGDDA